VTKIICGVDVSQKHLDVCLWPQEETGRFDNNPDGLLHLACWCLERQVALVVMEATGGHERQAYHGLWVQNVPCAIVNAHQVRCFAKAMGRLEKTDRIDAALIAHFAAIRQIGPGPEPHVDKERLRALTVRLQQITIDITVQKQRLSSTFDAESQDSLSQTIAFLTAQAKQIEAKIGGMIHDDPLWSHLDQALRSVKGVAGRTVACLMAHLPEIGTLSNKAIAKLVGLAPLADDSGRRTGQRRIKGGRSRVRSILFLVSAIAARFHDGLNAFAQRLQEQAKPKMVIRIALARKLLVILNAKARDARKEIATAT
jgi:transposase